MLVQGDTNTVSAAVQAGNYTGAPVVHVEAGLRSHDRAMPKEINRSVVGVLADLHCAPTERAVPNLVAEGVPAEKIVLTGNTIVEATLGMLPDDAAAREIAAGLGAEPGQYILATIHRPENTDDPERLRAILDELSKLGLPVLLPLHPRTRAAAERHSGSPPHSTGCAPSRLPTTGRSSPWPGTRAFWSPTPAGFRKSAPFSSAH